MVSGNAKTVVQSGGWRVNHMTLESSEAGVWGSTEGPVGCVTVVHEGLQWHLGSGDVLEDLVMSWRFW